MPGTKTKLLIVDDESSIRTSMSLVLTEIGYWVRSAEDGFSALAELRKELPDILVSDLNMPGMSGFELLSVVRRRFPWIQTIAMSGAFHGDEASSGVAARAFYQKGSSLGSLLMILEALPRPERMTPSQPAASAPIWIQRNERDPFGAACVTIACPECLRSFPQPLGGSISRMRETDCIYCRAPIRYAIEEPVEEAPVRFFQRNPAQEDSRPACLPQFYN
jgi:CheY-like chemotaxis protein